MIQNFSLILGILVLMFCSSINASLSNQLAGSSSIHLSAGEKPILNFFIQPVVKAKEPYDESKDPSLRRGTENWEEPQGSFFIIPGLVLGIIGLVLYFIKN